MAETPNRTVPLKPHKKLLLISSVLLAIWTGVLIFIYVKYVWPTRIGGATTTQVQ